ncbi:hypothetical protein KKF84_21475 [Myxococcota bacterium]|nr:hypothetical protein [Myxococcota bacterium]MBU1537897.1 hypothetical protein [Myxococcota bacterium]
MKNLQISVFLSGMAAIYLLLGCAQGSSGSDSCGNSICEDYEDQFSCPADCGPDTCGNGVIDEGEECDGSELGSKTCASEGRGTGTLTCYASCLLNYIGCSQSCIDACTLGESRCSDYTVEVCEILQSGCTGWTVGEDCSLQGKTCEVTGTLAACSDDCVSVCEPGTSRCDGDTVESCLLGQNGCMGWTPGADCSTTEQLCQFDGANAICVNECTDMCDAVGTVQCFGAVVQSCVLGSLGCLEWRNDQDCALQGKVCSDGSCQCSVICTPGDTRCVGTFLETCASGSFGCSNWSQTQDCASSALLCYDDGSTAQCAPACTDQCTLGAFTCNGNTVDECVMLGTGCLGWQAATDCVAQGQICTTGSCVCEASCTLSQTQCNGNNVEVCASNTFGCPAWQFQEDCTAISETCTAGSCSFTFSGYTQSTFSGVYSSISTSGAVQNLGGPYDDAWGNFSIPLFNFYGNDYSDMWISSNGWIAFGGDPGDSYPGNQSLPAAGNPQAAIYAFWDDHVIDTWYWTGAGLFLLVEGISPNRVATVEWKYTIHYDSTSWGDHRASFQVKLYEATGVIELLYDRGAWMGTIDWSGTVGIEDNARGDYLMAGSSFYTAPSSDIRYTPY